MHWQTATSRRTITAFPPPAKVCRPNWALWESTTYIHHELLKVATTGPSLSGTGTHTDWSRPAILIYEPQADGSLELVAIENLVFEAAWTVAFRDEELVLNGRNWDYMANAAGSRNGAHGFAPHYGQHVWLWRENPAGVLMPFNASVTCEHHRP